MRIGLMIVIFSDAYLRCSTFLLRKIAQMPVITIVRVGLLAETFGHRIVHVVAGIFRAMIANGSENRLSIAWNTFLQQRCPEKCRHIERALLERQKALVNW